MPVNEIAQIIGESYGRIYQTVYRDKIKAVGFEYQDEIRCVSLTAAAKQPKKEPALINEKIQGVMMSDNGQHGLHAH